MKFRYLIIDAEPWSTGIRDEFEGGIPVEELAVSQPFCLEFKRWLTAYQEQSMLRDSIDPEERKAVFKRLDDKGIEFSKRIKMFLGDDAKVGYYSDALGKRILWVA